jgi:catechol-2,3-dioxygenase
MHISGAYFYTAGEYHHHIVINVSIDCGSAGLENKLGFDHLAIKLLSKHDFDNVIEYLSNPKIAIKESTEYGLSKSS